jgi:2-phospho-L-lactate guanylyltransferase
MARPAQAGIVIPLRSFELGKARLADALDDVARAQLARTMADRVVDAAGARPVVVVTSALDVQKWATDRGLATIDDPGSLDGAAHAGRAWAAKACFDRYVIVHADLPNIVSLDAVVTDGDAPVAVVVPDHRDDGTPVLSLPTRCQFTFGYGPRSAARHVAEAQRCGLAVRILRDPALAFDVDVPADLDALADRTLP